jgi:hypothetical protein
VQLAVDCARLWALLAGLLGARFLQSAATTTPNAAAVASRDGRLGQAMLKVRPSYLFRSTTYNWKFAVIAEPRYSLYLAMYVVSMAMTLSRKRRPIY